MTRNLNVEHETVSKLETTFSGNSLFFLVPLFTITVVACLRLTDSLSC